MKIKFIVIGLTGVILLTAADAPEVLRPKSPKATDALRMDGAALRKARDAYWITCFAADSKLENELKSAADAAHARNDGKEEQACLDAAREVNERINFENDGRTGPLPVAPIKPLKCEGKEN